MKLGEFLLFNTPPNPDIDYSQHPRKPLLPAPSHSPSKGMLVTSCCVTNDHKSSSFPQQSCRIPQFLRIRSLGTASWVLRSGSPKASAKASAGLRSFLELRAVFQDLMAVGRIWVHTVVGPKSRLSRWPSAGGCFGHVALLPGSSHSYKPAGESV